MPRVNCFEAFKNGFPEVHEYLKNKSKVDFDGKNAGKEAYIRAIKELQENSLDTINDVYASIGIKGYTPSINKPKIEENASLQEDQKRDKKTSDTQAVQPEGDGLGEGQGTVRQETLAGQGAAALTAAAPLVTAAVIEINGKMYEGKNHAEAILKAQTDGQDISLVNRKAQGKFKLSDGTIIDRAEAKQRFGQDRSELLIEQDAAADQANKDYGKIPQKDTTQEGEGGVLSVLENVESTAKVLSPLIDLRDDVERFKKPDYAEDEIRHQGNIKKATAHIPVKYLNWDEPLSTQVAEAYHKAKEDGENPKLVKAVEDIISEQQTTPTKGEGVDIDFIAEKTGLQFDKSRDTNSWYGKGGDKAIRISDHPSKFTEKQKSIGEKNALDLDINYYSKEAIVHLINDTDPFANFKNGDKITHSAEKIGEVTYLNSDYKKGYVEVVTKDGRTVKYDMGKFLGKGNDLNNQTKQPTKGEGVVPSGLKKGNEDVGLGNKPMWKLTQEESYKVNGDFESGEGLVSHAEMANKTLKGFSEGKSGVTKEGNIIVYRNEKGKPIGYAKIDKYGVRELGVDENSRNKGIASKIINWLKEQAITDKLLPPFSKEGNVVSHRNEVKKAIQQGKYQKAISDGIMSATEAKEIIESAKVKVPQDIIELANQEFQTTPTKGEGVVPSGLKTGEKLETKAFHGTESDIADFDVNVNESKDGRNIKGVGWFSDHEAGAKAFGGKTIERNIKFDNPLVVDAKDVVGKEFRFKLPNGEYVYEINNVKELYVQRAKDKGHDGVVFINAKDGNMSGTVYGVFKNENISIKQTTPTKGEQAAKKSGVSVILPSQQKNVPTTTIAPKVFTRSLSSKEPPSKTGRTPVTLSGLTEQERQTMIKQRKAADFVPSKLVNEQRLLERVKRFDKLTKREKRKSNALREINDIRLSVDQFNKTYGEGHKVLTIAGKTELQNSKRKPVKTNNKLTGDLGIDETGVPLMQRNDITKQVFNDIMERDLFPTGRTTNGIRMSDDQLEGTIQDILDGMPSRRANNYLNALEEMIRINDFDYSKKDGEQQEQITIDMIREVEKQSTEPLTEEGVMEMLQDQGELTPEQEETVDNIENLITEYEQPQQTDGDIGQLQAANQEGQGAGSNTSEPAATPENTKAQAPQTAEDIFNERIDNFAGALIDFLTPKVDIKGAQKQGLGIADIVNAGVKVIKGAYKLEQNIEKAIAKGVQEMKNLWNANLTDPFPEQRLEKFMENQFRDLMPVKPTAQQPVSQKDADDNFISGILNTDIDEKSHPTILANNQTAKQLTAVTQGEGQNRNVDGDYVKALELDLREISIISSKALKDKFGAKWGEKTVTWLEQHPNQGNLAQIVGVLGVISTENYHDIQDTHDATKLGDLYSLQKRIDILTNRDARIASLALRQRQLYKKFAVGQNMSDILSHAIFTPEMLELQESLNAILSEPVSDAELNKAIPQPPKPPKKTTTISKIRSVTNKAKQKSDPNLKNELRAKAADISKKSGKSLQQLIDDANEKIKNTKC